MKPHHPHSNEVDGFLRQGGSVCPFARRTHRIYAEAGSRPQLLHAATLFADTKGKSPNGALLVLGPPIEDFEQTHAWAREVFLELMVCFGLIEGASEVELMSLIDRQVRPILLDDADPRRPMLGCNGDPLFAICMSPMYPKTHPRYAPRPTVVVTWHADVLEASKDSATARVRETIRQAMVREHGFVYDADALVLPLPKQDHEASLTRSPR